ncbi:oligosaccharyl transferase subunit ost3/OST6 [Coemansia brasiliensis]|uniref:Oligosaccharyl transferase subunit ost3/OST6 n=1 Tax=Coemansia brasiliensis TaxID=2650707 RepID=A0A9W8IGJ5_9FUNG|nr:oligosaccharyl transferase subunit ost3/OST6 [Coemansia brasiliensis]
MRLLAMMGLALASMCTAQSFGQLQQLSSRDPDGIASLKLDQFMEHVVPEDKDYAVVVQLTALAPEYKCDTCQVVDRSLRAVSRGWQKQQGSAERQIAFATLDVEDGEELFRKMGIDKIPRMMIFPPGRGPHAMSNPSPREMKLNARNSSPAGMASRLSELFHTEIRAHEPISFAAIAKYILGTVAACSGLFAVAKAVRRFSLRKLGRNVWAVCTITFVLVMTSGLMWNRINTPPFIGQTRAGEVVLFAPTNNQQFGVETQIVAAAYAVCALCVVLLVRHTLQVPGSDQRTLVTLLVLASLILTYSYINSVFRLKMPGYPFRLLLP